MSIEVKTVIPEAVSPPPNVVITLSLAEATWLLKAFNNAGVGAASLTADRVREGLQREIDASA